MKERVGDGKLMIIIIIVVFNPGDLYYLGYKK